MKTELFPFMKDRECPLKEREEIIKIVYVKESLLERLTDIFGIACLLIAWWMVMVIVTA